MIICIEKSCLEWWPWPHIPRSSKSVRESALYLLTATRRLRSYLRASVYLSCCTLERHPFLLPVLYFPIVLRRGSLPFFYPRKGTRTGWKSNLGTKRPRSGSTRYKSFHDFWAVPEWSYSANGTIERLDRSPFLRMIYFRLMVICIGEKRSNFRS